MTSRHDDLLVVGGGLMGLSCALAASERGMTVRLVEAETLARHASSASAGGVRSLNRHPAEIPLARAALPMWATLAERVGQDCGFRPVGQIRVAEDEAAMAALERRAALVEGLGYRHERLLSSAELRRRVPAIAAHCRGALAVDDDGFADPLASVHALHACARRHGVAIEERTRIVDVSARGEGLRLDGIGPAGPISYHATRCVNAAGAWAAPLASLAGDEVPMRAVALQMSVSAPVRPFLDVVLGSEGRKLSLKQSAAGALVIGGGYEGRLVERSPDGESGRGPSGHVVHSLLARNLAAAVSLFPELDSVRVVRTWAGLEGVTADGLPVIGTSTGLPALVHAFGFSAHGFALVPLVGTLMADLLEGREPAPALDAFAPDRFASARRTDASAGATYDNSGTDSEEAA